MPGFAGPADSNFSRVASTLTRKPPLLRDARLGPPRARLNRATMSAIARRGFAAPTTALAPGPAATRARRVKAMTSANKNDGSPSRRSRLALPRGGFVLGVPRERSLPLAAPRRRIRVTPNAASADAIHAPPAEEDDRRERMAAARRDGERVDNEHDDPASRRVRYAYLAAVVLATATAVAVSWLVAPELPAAIVPLMPRGLDCLDWTAAPGAFVRFVDYFGTAVFAQAGVVTAGTAGMNFLGCLIVGSITAMGGGSFRGFVLGEQVFWAQEPEYVYISLAASVFTFFFWPGVERLFAKAGKSDVLERSLNWLDALAIAGFCVIGANNGLRAAAGDPVVAVACGMFTASFGGIMRDTLCAAPARILHSHREAYASCTSVGAATFVTLSALGVNPWVRCLAPMAVVVALRWLAWSKGLRLPTYRTSAE